MKRPSLRLFACVLLFTAVAAPGCGEDEPPSDPDRVIEAALADLSRPAASGVPAGAQVEVTSLGYEDQSLRTRTLSVEPDVYAALKEGIAGRGGRSGLLGLAGGIESEGTTDIDGTEVNHVSGEFDVGTLVETLSGAIESGDTPGADAGLPGLGDLERLEETLTEATFDLYADTADDGFERLDLTLSLDDRENALPPTRIRFSLTETDATEAE
ncbi:MAG: hypothetical protein M3Y23_03330 [Actinomycetota bacterium]|nr:hypothetical protein [Actinomycetota bacterium]